MLQRLIKKVELVLHETTSNGPTQKHTSQHLTRIEIVVRVDMMKNVACCARAGQLLPTTLVPRGSSENQFFVASRSYTPVWLKMNETAFLSTGGDRRVIDA